MTTVGWLLLGQFSASDIKLNGRVCSQRSWAEVLGEALRGRTLRYVPVR